MPNLLYPTTGGGSGTGTTYEFESIRLSTSSAGYVTVVDHAVPGVLYQMVIKSDPLAGGADHLKITIDGYVENFTIGSTATWFLRFFDNYTAATAFMLSSNPGYYAAKPVFWQDEFIVEIKGDGVNSTVCKLQYSHG